MTSITNQRGQRTMLSALRAELACADEIAIAVAFTRCSGFSLLRGDLAEALGRGARVRLLTSTYMQITQPEALWALDQLQLSHAQLRCKVFMGRRGFHPKAFLFARSDGATRCWAGSSNLTRGGLVSNIEWNIMREDSAAHREASALFDALWADPASYPLDDALIQLYRASLRAAPALATAPLHDDAERFMDTTAPLTLGAALPQPNAAQREALEALGRCRAAGARRAAVIAATGVGKTYLAAFEARQLNAARVLYISHRLEHLEQAQRTFARVFADREVSSGLVGDGRREGDREHVFATVVGAANLLRAGDQRFDLTVIDEFHHASAPIYQEVMGLLGESWMLGLTATPERTDGQDVLALCDHNVAYELRLSDAIARDLLIPFHYFGLCDALDYSPVPWRSGRFDPAALEHALMVETRADAALTRALEHGFDGPKRVAVGFCAGVRHARFMAERFNARGQVAAHADGTMGLAARQALYARLQDPADPLEWLFVADLLNEGVDLPAINVALFLRPTESASLFLQQLGRGLRLSPGCEVLTALDFVGNHRGAWLPLQAMHDAANALGGEPVEGLGGELIVPPWGCQVVLERRTQEVLQRIRRHESKPKERVSNAYIALREALGRAPELADCLGIELAPQLAEVRAAYGDWIGLQAAHGDAPAALAALAVDAPERVLLKALERDWQQQRVSAYALLWGALRGVSDAAFYSAHPRWEVERTAPPSSLTDRLGAAVWDASGLVVEVDDALREAADVRMGYWLARDWALRHGGTLRTPDDLVLWRAYTRQQIVNHFGVQYDPARHNVGVLELMDGRHMALITKLDTSAARQTQQYTNAFLEGAGRFAWQSQNRQRRDKGSGQRLVEHAARGIALHLFVQAGSGSLAYYLGQVTVEAASGDAPIDVTFALERVPPMTTLARLNVELRT
jgi:superfamily II DNA or RNA helicase/HKD family nuclease